MWQDQLQAIPSRVCYNAMQVFCFILWIVVLASPLAALVEQRMEATLLRNHEAVEVLISILPSVPHSRNLDCFFQHQSHPTSLPFKIFSVTKDAKADTVAEPGECDILHGKFQAEWIFEDILWRISAVTYYWHYRVSGVGWLLAHHFFWKL